MKNIIVLFFVILSVASSGKQIDIKIAKTTSGIENYIKKLLTNSLEELGYETNIKFSSEELGFERGFGALENGEIDLFWSGNRDKLNDNIYYLDIPVTNNLLGKRIMLIPKGDAHCYSDIYELEDLRSSGKVGGFGRDWTDVEIWKKNKLPYFEKENGNWEAIFIMMAKKTRGIDYFSRGVIEIIPEMENIVKKNNYAIEIETNLLFQYNLDFLMYLNKKNDKKNEIIKEALEYARDTGLMEKVVKQHWRKNLEELNLKNRRVIHIDN